MYEQVCNKQLTIKSQEQNLKDKDKEVIFIEDQDKKFINSQGANCMVR